MWHYVPETMAVDFEDPHASPRMHLRFVSEQDQNDSLRQSST